MQVILFFCIRYSWSTFWQLSRYIPTTATSQNEDNESTTHHFLNLQNIIKILSSEINNLCRKYEKKR